MKYPLNDPSKIRQLGGVRKKIASLYNPCTCSVQKLKPFVSKINKTTDDGGAENDGGPEKINIDIAPRPVSETEYPPRPNDFETSSCESGRRREPGRARHRARIRHTVRRGCAERRGGAYQYREKRRRGKRRMELETKQ